MSDSECEIEKGYQFCSCKKHPEVFGSAVLVKEFEGHPVGTELVILDVAPKLKAYAVEVGPWQDGGIPTDVTVVPYDNVQISSTWPRTNPEPNPAG